MITKELQGIPVKLDPKSVKTGGQGKVLFGHVSGNPSLPVVLKVLPDKASIRKRLDLLTEREIGQTVPHLSAPLVWQTWPYENGLAYLTTFSAGRPANQDIKRSFSERLALLARASALWQLMTTSGLVHCDISFNNILVRPDGFIDIIDVDNCLIQGEPTSKPEKAGQVIMMAPEIRKHMNTDQVVHPNEFSDRFSWAILFNQLLLSRHPLDGIAQSAAHRDKLLARGDWLELERDERPDQQPYKAIGRELTDCFRRGFSLVPERRTAADEWLNATEKSLERLYQHDCGGVFVCDHDQGICPYCHEPYQKKTAIGRVVITQLSTGQSRVFQLLENEPLVVGRANAPFLKRVVSRQHLEVLYDGMRLCVRNLGRNRGKLKGGQLAQNNGLIYNRSWTPESTARLILDIQDERLQLTIRK